MRHKYLFNFVNKNSGYFTMMGFLGAFLSVSFFIPPLENSSVSWVTDAIQGVLLIIFLFSFFPLFNELKKSSAKSIKWFSGFFLILFLLFVIYLWNGYKEGIIICTMILVWGYSIYLSATLGNFLTKNKKFKKKEMPPKSIIVLFIITIIINLYLIIFKGFNVWFSWIDIVANDIGIVLIKNTVIFVFLGLGSFLFIFLLGIIMKYLESLKKEFPKTIKNLLESKKP